MTFPLHLAVDRLDAATSRRLQHLVGDAVPAVAPALSLVVWHSGACRFDIHAGWVDPEAEEHPVHGDALFDLASLTKLFTTTGFLALAANGRVALDDAVATVLPAFSASGSRGVDGGQEPLGRQPIPTPDDRVGWIVDPAGVTFRQLLTHTSGLAPWRSVFRSSGPVPPPPGRPDPIAIAARWTAGLEAIFASPFVARPGEVVRYSDLGFILLGAAIRRLTDRPLEASVSGLADALGLSSVGYRPLEGGIPLERIVPTSVDDDWRHRRLHGEVEDENAAGLGGVAGHAGLFGTGRDLARFGQAWLARDRRLGLEPDDCAAAVADQTPGLGEARGLGWQVQPTDHLAPFGPHAFGHTGFTGTSLAVDPDRELVVVLLTNRVYAGRTHPGIDQLRLHVHHALASRGS